MHTKAQLIAALALGSLVAVGCSAGANINPLTVGPRDQFCTDTATFQSAAANVEAASTQDLATVRASVDTVVGDLKAMNTDAAKIPDKVNGHLVRDDLATALSTYTTLQTALANANPSDPNALTNALASVQKSEGEAFTKATGRLDSYTKKACGLVVSNPTSTVPGSTTIAPTTSTTGATGTTVPQTLPGAATTAPVVGPTAPPTTP